MKSAFQSGVPGRMGPFRSLLPLSHTLMPTTLSVQGDLLEPYLEQYRNYLMPEPSGDWQIPEADSPSIARGLTTRDGGTGFPREDLSHGRSVQGYVSATWSFPGVV